MEWLAFAGSVLGGLISGLFTFIGVRLSISHDEYKKQRERIEKAKNEKPRLEIVSLKTVDEASETEVPNNDCNVLALDIEKFRVEEGRSCFYYNEAALEIKNLTFAEYELINNGSTEIEDICVTSNIPDFMSLIEFERKDFYIKERFLNYGVWSNKRYIKPKDTFTLRVYYIKGEIPTTTFGCPELVIWLRDVNDFVWSQTLDAPTKDIEKPIMRSDALLREACDILPTIRSFREKMEQRGKHAR
ncbi:MAG: hypothetical protein K6G74_03125 [Bacilli bacterium]|nr:hypothetical protein [Bacilli bacterium]